MKEWIFNNLNWICPLIITIVFSILNIVIASNNYKLIKLQGKMQNDNFCFQLFEKRHLIYENLKRILCSVIVEGTVSSDDVNKFNIASKDVRFLFGTDMVDISEKILKVLNELRTVSMKIENNIQHQNDDPKHSDLCDRQSELFSQLEDYQKEITTVAYSYISFANYTIKNQ